MKTAISLGFLFALALSFWACSGRTPIAIEHTVIILKENHTFDNYFGTFPGADGANSGLTSNGLVVPLAPMPDTQGRWATTRFVEPTDLRHDMHVNIVTLEPGAVIPFTETHVMEHGLYVLEGKAVYRLNRDWVEVEAGDFMWLRAFCPQACYAGGPGRFRYLLYKDVNRHVSLTPFA